MPIYEYQCTNCHHHFDLMQKVSEAPVKQCPQCFENTAVRMVSAPGFQLKGNGWYVTDFKNKNSPPAKNEEFSDKEASPSDKKSTETPTKETKPTTKPSGEND